MSVATHLGIDLAQYDARIRTFIPDYEEMLDVAAAVIDPKSELIVDLGIGTGALSARCLSSAPHARIVGIDSDPEILKAAARRLPATSTFVCSNFQRAEIPICDAVVASFALHHVRTLAAKGKLYGRIALATRTGGQLIAVDCNPSTDRALAREQHTAWKAHLMKSYSPKQSAEFLEAWAQEDVYVPLNEEIALMQKAGFSIEVLWRKNAFAVLRGRR